MTQVLRPLTLAELLDRTFSLYRQHIVVFIGIIALPNLLVMGANILNAINLAGSPDDVSRVLLSLAATLVIGLISMFTLTISQAATMVAVSRVHLNQPVSIGAAFAGLKGRLFRLCFISIGLVLQIVLGFFLLIVPGIYLALRWSLAIPVVVLEQAGLATGISRSATLVEGQYGRVFMIYFLYFLVSMSLQSALMMPFVIYAILTANSIAAAPLWVQVGMQAGQFITQCLVAPLVTIAIALVYYDSRVRKEAFDLEHMLSQLEPAPPAAATTA